MATPTPQRRYRQRTFNGRGGNDTIDGGANTDTAVFSGLHTAYTVTSSGGSSFQLSGPDGTDTVSNVETYRFDDGTFTIGNHSKPRI